MGIMEAYVIYGGCFFPPLLGKAQAVAIGDERISSCFDKKNLKIDICGVFCCLIFKSRYFTIMISNDIKEKSITCCDKKNLLIMTIIRHKK